MNWADLKMYSMQAIQSFPVVDVLRDLAIVFPASNDTQLFRRINKSMPQAHAFSRWFPPTATKKSL